MWQQESGRLEGEVLIISVPLITGKHFAAQVADFVPVVRSLQEIHEAGCVHGDVRCLNIVFGKGLIDFDYGGLVDSADPPIYPPGYKNCLPDGDRLGRRGEVITMAHDWYALIDVMFSLHHLSPPPGESDEAGAQMDSLLWRRQLAFWHLFDDKGPAPNELTELPHKLIQFLRDAEDARWTVRPSYRLRTACGL
jgi:hypothetical protein